MKSIHKRWLKEYNICNRDSTPSQPVVDADVPIIYHRKMPAEGVRNVLKPAEKHHKIQEVIMDLKGAAEACGTRVFYERYQLLKDLLVAWQEGSEVALVHLGFTPNEEGNFCLK